MSTAWGLGEKNDHYQCHQEIIFKLVKSQEAMLEKLVKSQEEMFGRLCKVLKHGNDDDDDDDDDEDDGSLLTEEIANEVSHYDDQEDEQVSAVQNIVS
ncbi:hypothetical protein MKX01_036428, partial [Papaver californicum]